MSKNLTLFIALLLCVIMNGQGTTFVFQPDSACGKDAYLSSLLPNNNYGSHPDFLATAWTNGGTASIARGLLAFNLTGVPVNATVVNASLELFHYNSTANIGHSTLSGPNDATLYRVTAPWNEHTVTWNTQPAYTATNSVFVPASTSATENYTVNVTALIQDMVSDPLHSYGFLFKENVESYYRSMLFASSDESNPLLHPKLTITLASPVSLYNPCPGFSVTPVTPVAPDTLDGLSGLLVPNVFTPNSDGQNDSYYITCDGCKDYSMLIYDRWGLLIAQLRPESAAWSGKAPNGCACPEGVYYYLLTTWPFSGEPDSKRGYITLLGGQ